VIGPSAYTTTETADDVKKKVQQQHTS
jgi:hypothetical protein